MKEIDNKNCEKRKIQLEKGYDSNKGQAGKRVKKHYGRAEELTQKVVNEITLSNQGFTKQLKSKLENE